MEKQQLTITDPKGSAFSGIQAFENAQRMAQVLAKSDLVPKEYRNNLPNVMIALEMANRVGVSPFMIMQNMNIIHGKPSWNSSFIIAVLNSCGRFSPLRFEFSGDGDAYGCEAVATDAKGNELRGTKITNRMVKAEGWAVRSGSKWKTMADQMFRYRAAAFFGRVYAPDLLNGMHAADEITDMRPAPDLVSENFDKEIRRAHFFMVKCETIPELVELWEKLPTHIQESLEPEYKERFNELNVIQVDES